jgi:hypothetical protein
MTEKKEMLVVTDNSELSALMDTAKFEHVQRIGKLFASSDMVPDHFKGKEANCIIAISMAHRLGCDPMQMFQNMYVVHGKPGIEAKLAIALANSAGVFTGPIEFEYSGSGKSRSCRAFATMSKSGRGCEQTMTMAIADAEGWVSKKGSKWQTMPDLMLSYRSAMFLIRLHCPEVILGMSSADEVEDIASQRNITKEVNDIILTKPEPAKIEKVEKVKEPEQTILGSTDQSPFEKLWNDPEYQGAIEAAVSDGKIPAEMPTSEADQDMFLPIIEQYKEMF